MQQVIIVFGFLFEYRLLDCWARDIVRERFIRFMTGQVLYCTSSYRNACKISRWWARRFESTFCFEIWYASPQQHIGAVYLSWMWNKFWHIFAATLFCQIQRYKLKHFSETDPGLFFNNTFNFDFQDNLVGLCNVKKIIKAMALCERLLNMIHNKGFCTA